jgi:undecaprenyl-diphosphatase
MDPIVRRFARLSLICWLAGILVIALAWGGVLQSFDDAALRGLRSFGNALPGFATDLMRGASWLGDGWPRSILAIGFIVYLMIRRLARAASYILYTALGIAALNAWVLKAIVMRARPDIVPRLVEVDQSWSLPSGHAANSAAVYGAIALVATVLWWRKRQRRAIWAVTGLLVFAIGLSRVWLGVHWPSDVVAGWLVGAGWALLLGVLLKPVQMRGTVTPPRKPA